MLARVKDPQGGAPLVRLLSDDDPMVRKAGAIALEQLAGVMDTAAATAFVQYFQSAADNGQRNAIIHLLGVTPTAIHPLTALLTHPRRRLV